MQCFSIAPDSPKDANTPGSGADLTANDFLHQKQRQHQKYQHHAALKETVPKPAGIEAFHGYG